MKENNKLKIVNFKNIEKICGAGPDESSVENNERV